MSIFLDAVERLSIIAADLLLVPILALSGLVRAGRTAQAPSSASQAAPASRPSARPSRTSTA